MVTLTWHTHTQLFAAKPQLDEEFSEDDFISSNSSSRRTSFSSLNANSSQTSLTLNEDSDRPLNPLIHSKAFRRRSSTSDTSRFREKMQSLSRSAEIHERMMIESPKETEASKTIVSEQFNSNGNNNSPQAEMADGAYLAPFDHVTTENESQDSSESDSKSFEAPDVLSVLNTVYDLWTVVHVYYYRSECNYNYSVENTSVRIMTSHQLSCLQFDLLFQIFL